MIWPFLPLIIALGLYTSYEDIKEGKIRNFHILTAVVLAALTWYFLFVLQLAGASEIGRTFLYGLYGFLIGFFIWLVGLWSAGDAKLFAAFAFLIPASAYKWIGFPLTKLIINTILPIFVVLIFILLIKSSWKEKKQVMKNLSDYKLILTLLLTIFSLSWIVVYILNFIHIYQNFIFNVLGIFALIWILRKYIPKYINYVLISLALLRIVFNFDSIMQILFWKEFLFLTLAYVLLWIVFNNLGFIFFSKNVNIYHLKEGMIPAELIIKIKEDYEKKNVSDYGLAQFKTKIKDSVYEPTITGLTKKDIERVRALFQKKRFHFDNLRIQQTMPFAPFMFLGAIITVLMSLFNFVF
ncbi:A24 family peptidase C-terminal domain-containing protein [Nanoarchaeota archaeon]